MSSGQVDPDQGAGQFDPNRDDTLPQAQLECLVMAWTTLDRSTTQVYLDNNATTPLDPRVREAMAPWLGERFGNPSSIHAFGQAARGAVEEAREKVAALLGARPLEVVFTASGTEANNAVIFDLAERGAGSRDRAQERLGHLVISAFEHPSVREAANRLERRGFAVTRVAPHGGVVNPEEMIGAIRDDTRLIALMLANNELGTIQRVAAVASAARERGIPVLCDAVQATGKIAVNVSELGVDALVIGGHKFHGPLGAAALWLRKGFDLTSFVVGGGQERRRRAGTENVAALVGLGRACEIAANELPNRAAHLAHLRDRFEARLGDVEGARAHCVELPRLPNTSHIAVDGLEGEALLIRLDLAGFAVSTGSACSSGTVEPSKGLLAAGFSVDEALSSLRISFGLENTEADVDAFVDALAREAAALRAVAATPAGVGR